MKSILDRSFNYTPAAETDLKKTFARLKREAAAQKKADEPKLAAAVVVFSPCIYGRRPR